MCLRDARFKHFKDSILGMITASLYDGLVYFSYYPDLTLALDDANIIKALTLNIASSGVITWKKVVNLLGRTLWE